MNEPRLCPHGLPLTAACDGCEADLRAARLIAARQAAETAHANAKVTAGELVALCELLPADPLAVKLIAIARPLQPDAAMMIAAAHLRALVSKADALASPNPEPEKPPAEGA